MFKSFFRRMIITTAICSALAGQSPTVPTSFEVADIHRSKSGTMHSGGILPGGQIHFQAYSLKELIIFAWDLEPDMVAGPSWINSDHFDVVAKTPSPVPLPTVRLMTKSLLMERFQLSVHTEDKDVPVYALIPGKHGPKLKPAGSSSDSGCKFQMTEGTRTYVCRNMTMTGLAERLRDVAPAYLDRPVIDLTTIKGSFDFSLSWMSRGKAQVAVHPGGRKSARRQ